MTAFAIRLEPVCIYIYLCIIMWGKDTSIDKVNDLYSLCIYSLNKFTPYTCTGSFLYSIVCDSYN